MRYHPLTLSRRAAVIVALAAGLPARTLALITVPPYPEQPKVSPYPDGEPPDKPPMATTSDGKPAVGDYGSHVRSRPTEKPTIEGEPGSYRVVDATGTITHDPEIRLPESCDNKNNDLYKHEMGHHKIAKHEYDKLAVAKTADAMVGLKSKTFPTKRAAALEAYRVIGGLAQKIESEIMTLQRTYDTMTKEGTASTPTADDAYERLTNGVSSAPQAGTTYTCPYPHAPVVGIGEPPAVEFVNGDLHFTGDRVLDYSNNPADPLVKFGSIQIADMTPIGVTPSGAIRLTDATFEILAPSGSPLVRGLLVQVGYSPSSVPGFAGMIQAALWIMPPEFGGVDTTLASPMLDEMAAAGAADRLMTFWFFADNALFTPEGDPALTRLPAPRSTGVVKVGYGVTIPEPGAVLTLLAGVSLIAIHRRGRAA